MKERESQRETERMRETHREGEREREREREREERKEFGPVGILTQVLCSKIPNSDTVIFFYICNYLLFISKISISIYYLQH